MRYYKTIIAISIIIFLIFFSYKAYYNRIALIPQKCVNMTGMILGQDIKINDIAEIKKITTFINTMKKSYNLKHRQTNESPDSILVFSDIGGDYIELWLYGNYIFCNNKQYKIKDDELQCLLNLIKSCASE